MMEVFLKAYERADDERYLNAAMKCVRALTVPTAEGGVVIKETDDAWWFDEYASGQDGRTESFVLNGHVFSLLSLHELHCATGEGEVTRLFRSDGQTFSGDVD